MVSLAPDKAVVAVDDNCGESASIESVKSSCSSSNDFDAPYQETAAEWWNRTAERRARRNNGIGSGDNGVTSSGGSISSEESCDAADNGDFSSGEDTATGRGPLGRWLRTYPTVASNCFWRWPSMPLGTRQRHHRDEYDTVYKANVKVRSLRERAQEVSKLKRILMRRQRKLRESRLKKEMLRRRCRDATDSSNVPACASDACAGATSDAGGAAKGGPPGCHLNENLKKINQEDIGIDGIELVADAMLPIGSGLPFVDAVLSAGVAARNRSTSHKPRQQDNSCDGSNMVMELAGPASSGKTSITLSLAAKYTVTTSTQFLMNENSSTDCTSQSTLAEPRVVLLDLDHGVHIVNLAQAVRVAVLQRWRETSVVRSWIKNQRKQQLGAIFIGGVDDQTEEGERIDAAVGSCLGRIHIIRPRDFTHSSVVATLECLRQSLDIERMKRLQKMGENPTGGRFYSGHFSLGKENEPMTLILIDSLSTLESSTRAYENLTTGTPASGIGGTSSGLSGRNEFHRQLLRLLEEHSIVIVGTRLDNQSSSLVKGEGGNFTSRGSAGNIWDRMVTHHISLRHVVDGTKEDKDGYDFVALLSSCKNQGRTANDVFPFSISNGGISC